MWPVSSKSHLGSYLRESEVKVLVSLYMTLCDPVDWGPPGSSVHRII